MKKRQTIWTLILLAALLAGAPGAALASGQVEGTPVLISAQPIKATQTTESFPIRIGRDILYGRYQDGIAMIPLRASAQSLGYQVLWNGQARRAELVQGPHYTAVTPGENSYFKNRMSPGPLSAAPVLEDGTLYVPVEFLCDILPHGIRIASGNLEVLRAQDANDCVTGYVTEISGDEESGLSYRICDEPDCEDPTAGVVLHTAPDITFLQKTPAVGERIRAITSPASTLSLPPQTSAYLIY